jgi:hypothetical protein
MSGLHGSLVSVQLEEHSPFQRAMMQLLDIQEQLELVNQRLCTEGALNLFISDLQNIVQDVSRIPSETLSLLITSKRVFLKYVRNASIELLLALDQLVAKGRTHRFYKHLSVCQEYLEEAFACKIDRQTTSLSAESYLDMSQLPSGNPPTRIQQHSADILTSQTALEHEQESLANNDGLPSDHYNALLAALSGLSTPVKALCRWLDETRHFSEEPSLSYYQLQIHLYYVDEQARRLIALIRTLHTISCLSSRQAKRIRLEISHTLESLLRSSDDIPPALTALLDQMRFYRKSTPRLRLITSREYAAKEE